MEGGENVFEAAVGVERYTEGEDQLRRNRNQNGESTKGGLREGTGGRMVEAHLVELEGSTFQSSSSDTPRETETTQAVVYLAPLDQYILERGGS